MGLFLSSSPHEVLWYEALWVWAHQVTAHAASRWPCPAHLWLTRDPAVTSSTHAAAKRAWDILMKTFKHCIIHRAMRKQPQTLYSFFQDSKRSMKEFPSSMRPDSKRRALAKDRMALRARSVSLAAHKPRLVVGSLSSTSPSSSSIISSKMAVCPFTLPRMHKKIKFTDYPYCIYILNE